TELLDELAAMCRSLADVRALLITHGDSDHLGFAERLRKEAGVPVYVHKADAARARGTDKPKTTWGRFKIGAVLRFLLYAGRRGGLRTTYLSDLRELSG